MILTDPLELCQIGWEVTVNSHLQVSTCFMRFKSGPWLSHSRTVRLVLEWLSLKCAKSEGV